MPWWWFAFVPIPITNIVIAPFWDYGPITEWWKSATQSLLEAHKLVALASFAAVAPEGAVERMSRLGVTINPKPASGGAATPATSP